VGSLCRWVAVLLTGCLQGQVLAMGEVEAGWVCRSGMRNTGSVQEVMARCRPLLVGLEVAVLQPVLAVRSMDEEHLSLSVVVGIYNCWMRVMTEQHLILL